MEVVLDVSGSKLTKREHLLLLRDAQSIIAKFGRQFSKARFSLRVKAHAAKRLIEVKGRLITDKGQFFSHSEGWKKDFTCLHALERISAQLSKKSKSF